MPGRIWLDTDGMADDWPPPRRSLPRWARWGLPLAALTLVAGLVFGLGGFEQRRYRPDVRQPGTTVTMDGFDITPLEAFVMPPNSKLDKTIQVRVLATCENRRDDSVALLQLAKGGILVVDPLDPRGNPSSELWAGTWTEVGQPTLAPGQGVVPCYIRAELPDTYQPTGTILLQLSNVTYADRTILQFGEKSWGGATQDFIFYLPLSYR